MEDEETSGELTEEKGFFFRNRDLNPMVELFLSLLRRTVDELITTPKPISERNENRRIEDEEEGEIEHCRFRGKLKRVKENGDFRLVTSLLITNYREMEERERLKNGGMALTGVEILFYFILFLYIVGECMKKTS